MDLAATLACFTPDARVTIATYNTLYQGRDTEIRAMFERLNARYAQVWHGDFDHVVQGPNRIASRFRVERVCKILCKRTIHRRLRPACP
jgi:SnoaL-like domain